MLCDAQMAVQHSMNPRDGVQHTEQRQTSPVHSGRNLASACRGIRRPLPPQHTATHQQEDPGTREDEQRGDEPQWHIAPTRGLGARRVEEVGMAGELALEFLPQGVGVLRDLAAYLLAQGVELLPQTLFPGVQLRLQIPPRCLLGPEGEDAQERGSEGSLLVRRKPGIA